MSILCKCCERIWENLSMTMFLMHSIENVVIIVNIIKLLIYPWKPRKSIDLYNKVNNMLVLPALNKS